MFPLYFIIGGDYMNFDSIKNNHVFIRCKQQELLQVLKSIKRFIDDEHFVAVHKKIAEEIRTKIQFMQEEIEDCYRKIYALENKQMQEIMMLKYEEGIPIDDIAERLNLSKCKVRKLHDIALKKCEGR